MTITDYLNDIKRLSDNDQPDELHRAISTLTWYVLFEPEDGFFKANAVSMINSIIPVVSERYRAYDLVRLAIDDFMPIYNLSKVSKGQPHPKDLNTWLSQDFWLNFKDNYHRIYGIAWNHKDAYKHIDETQSLDSVAQDKSPAIISSDIEPVGIHKTTQKLSTDSNSSKIKQYHYSTSHRTDISSKPTTTTADNLQKLGIYRQKVKPKDFEPTVVNHNDAFNDESIRSFGNR
jgi:hypothetical protein